jgi:endonuclease G
MGSCERPKGWDYNPYLSVSDQVNLCSRSYADDYSRGHLIPNASRNGNRDMQLQTFYVTNSVPQVQDGFNGGIWQRLEAGLQSVAESERIYIVTGVAFEKMGEERDVVYTMARDDVKRVPVPKYFYKVALKVAYDDAGEVCDAQSVGFWFENRSYKGGFVEHTQSVDTIEEWTGFDFFPNLPDDVEVRAETNANWNKFTSF